MANPRLKLFRFTNHLLALARNEDEARQKILEVMRYDDSIRKTLNDNPPKVIAEPYAHIVFTNVKVSEAIY